MNSNDDSKLREGDSSVPAEYKKDKNRESIFNIVIGILFLMWTAFDVISGLEESWYLHVPFGLVGLAFLVYGIVQIRSQRSSRKPDR